MFQLSENELNKLVTNCDRLNVLKHSSSRPFAFTEQGVAMLSAVLRSVTAVQVSIRIIDAFVAMRKFLLSNAQVFQRLNDIETKQAITDKKIDDIFLKLEEGDIKPRQGIFYDGQVFDAYHFISDLVKSASESVVLIDNYVDDSVLNLFTCCKKSVCIKIYTSAITPKLKLDALKFKEQYAAVAIEEFKKSHDRFLIIDDAVYHFGASLKDLGKKWFAFSKMEMPKAEIMGRLLNR